MPEQEPIPIVDGNVFNGSIDQVEIYSDRWIFQGWLHDARLSAGESTGLIISGIRILGKLVATGKRPDLMNLRYGTHLRAFSLNLPVLPSDSFPPETLCVCSHDGQFRLPDQEILLFDFSKEKNPDPERICTRATNVKPYAFRVKPSANAPDRIYIDALLPSPPDELTRLRLSLPGSGLTFWLDSTPHFKSTTETSQNRFFRTFVNAPEYLLDGNIHEFRIDATHRKRLLSGFSSHLSLPAIVSFRKQLEQQKELTRTYYAELAESESDLLKLNEEKSALEQKMISKLNTLSSELNTATSKVEELEKLLSQAENKRSELDSRLERIAKEKDAELISQNNAHKAKVKDFENQLKGQEIEIARLKATLEERQKTIYWLKTQREEQMESRKQLQAAIRNL